MTYCHLIEHTVERNCTRNASCSQLKITKKKVVESRHHRGSLQADPLSDAAVGCGSGHPDISVGNNTVPHQPKRRAILLLLLMMCFLLWTWRVFKTCVYAINLNVAGHLRETNTWRYRQEMAEHNDWGRDVTGRHGWRHTSRHV